MAQRPQGAGRRVYITLMHYITGKSIHAEEQDGQIFMLLQISLHCVSSRGNPVVGDIMIMA